jgi:hypothetical protein
MKPRKVRKLQKKNLRVADTVSCGLIKEASLQHGSAR